MKSESKRFVIPLVFCRSCWDSSTGGSDINLSFWGTDLRLATQRFQSQTVKSKSCIDLKDLEVKRGFSYIFPNMAFLSFLFLTSVVAWQGANRYPLQPWRCNKSCTEQRLLWNGPTRFDSEKASPSCSKLPKFLISRVVWWLKQRISAW